MQQPVTTRSTIHWQLQTQKWKEKSQALSILSASKRGELAFLFAHWSCLFCRWTYHQLFDFCCSGCQWTAGHSDHEKGWPGRLLVGFARLDWFEIWGVFKDHRCTFFPRAERKDGLCFSSKNIQKYVNRWWTCARHNVFFWGVIQELICDAVLVFMDFFSLQLSRTLPWLYTNTVVVYILAALLFQLYLFRFWPVRYLVECLKSIESTASRQSICFDIFGLSSPWCYSFDV